VWQENFRKNKARRLAAEFGEHFAKGMMAVRFQQCLYRAIIDTSLVNRAARKIWKTGARLSRELNPYSVVYSFS